MLDGGAGVTVDNVGLRGCAGFIFSSISSSVMQESFARTNTRLIIMQFGGNALPGITSTSGISRYMDRLRKQFVYFNKVAPEAKILFIGPSDMGKSENGEIITWPRLEELNDSLKALSLKNGAAYWDTFNVMGGNGSMKRWVKHNPPYAGPDYIHFTNKGAEYIGDALSKSFLLYYDFYKIRQDMTDKAVLDYMNMLSDSLGTPKVLSGGLEEHAYALGE
jgi:lysophospholipase L1-like esterase